MAALVYGLSNAATSPDGTSHWGDAKVVAALAAGAVLLAAFAFIEARSRHALLPVRLLRSRDRLGANLMMLAVGTTVFGVFFFLTLFVQELWGYSPLRTGVAFLPLTAALLAASATAAQLVPRIGARPLLMAGAAASAGGLYWLSRMTEHGTYAGGLLGPVLVVGVGLGLLFVPLSLVALARVAEADSGVASSLLNTGRQVGRLHRPRGAGHGGLDGGRQRRPRPRRRGPGDPDGGGAAAYRHALAAGFDRAFLSPPGSPCSSW